MHAATYSKYLERARKAGLSGAKAIAEAKRRVAQAATTALPGDRGWPLSKPSSSRAPQRGATPRAAKGKAARTSISPQTAAYLADVHFSTSPGVAGGGGPAPFAPAGGSGGKYLPASGNAFLTYVLAAGKCLTITPSPHSDAPISLSENANNAVDADNYLHHDGSAYTNCRTPYTSAAGSVLMAVEFATSDPRDYLGGSPQTHQYMFMGGNVEMDVAVPTDGMVNVYQAGVDECRTALGRHGRLADSGTDYVGANNNQRHRFECDVSQRANLLRGVVQPSIQMGGSNTAVQSYVLNVPDNQQRWMRHSAQTHGTTIDHDTEAPCGSPYYSLLEGNGFMQVQNTGTVNITINLRAFFQYACYVDNDSPLINLALPIPNGAPPPHYPALGGFTGNGATIAEARARAAVRSHDAAVATGIAPPVPRDLVVRTAMEAAQAPVITAPTITEAKPRMPDWLKRGLKMAGGIALEGGAALAVELPPLAAMLGFAGAGLLESAVAKPQPTHYRV